MVTHGTGPTVLSLGWGEELPLPCPPPQGPSPRWAGPLGHVLFPVPAGHPHGACPPLPGLPTPAQCSAGPQHAGSHVSLSVCVSSAPPPPAGREPPGQGLALVRQKAPTWGGPGSAHTGCGGLASVSPRGWGRKVPPPQPPPGHSQALQGTGPGSLVCGGAESRSPPYRAAPSCLPPAHVWVLLWAGGPVRSSQGRAWGGGRGPAQCHCGAGRVDVGTEQGTLGKDLSPGGTQRCFSLLLHSSRGVHLPVHPPAHLQRAQVLRVCSKAPRC